MSDEFEEDDFFEDEEDFDEDDFDEEGELDSMFPDYDPETDDPDDRELSFEDD